jgi:hypothetical protein
MIEPASTEAAGTVLTAACGATARLRIISDPRPETAAAWERAVEIILRPGPQRIEAGAVMNPASRAGEASGGTVL